MALQVHTIMQDRDLLVGHKRERRVISREKIDFGGMTTGL
jgi:hypothetical protein